MTQARTFADLAEYWNGSALALPVGTLAAPSYSFKTEPGTGMSMAASGQLSFGVQGAYAMHLYADKHIDLGGPIYLAVNNSPSAPLTIIDSGKTDCPLMFQGNLLQFFSDAHMLYARDGAVKWGWDTDGRFYSNGHFDAGHSGNASWGRLGQGYIELRSAGPFIDFSNDYSDFHWRIQEDSSSRLTFRNWNGRYVYFQNDANIYCEGRGYVWDAINTAQTTANDRVRKITGNDIGIEWAGPDSSYRMYVDGVNRWNMFCSEDNRVKSPWLVATNYLRIWIDGTAYAINFVASDRRLKKNIEPARDGARAIVDAIPVAAFDWNEQSLNPGAHVDYGIVAQDAIEAYPAIAFKTIADKPEDEMYTQDVQATVNLLLKAVQELSAKVRELEAKLS